MTDRRGREIEVQRKRLRFRSRHRGIKEMDVMLGGFADRHLAAFSARQLARYEALLEMSDPDLYAWITGRAAVPEAHDHDVMRLLKAFKIKK